MAKAAKKATSRVKAAPKSTPTVKSAHQKAPEKPVIGMQRVLTAEGWKRLMMGNSKNKKKG
jgi:hypothetical protein